VLSFLLVASTAYAQNTSSSPASLWSQETQLRDVRDPDMVRGVWVTRWEYSSPEAVTALMSRAAARGLTDVFFQVRGRADAFYRSSLEPWGGELTGVLGRDPGWDPLEVALREANARGLRLHAWINTFPIWNSHLPPPETSPRHVYLDHPDWIMSNRAGQTQRLGNRFGYVSASPGNPEVQAHIQAVVLDIVSRYAVDGVHFDYIRLPDQDYSYDAVSRGRFLRESRDETYMQWQAKEISGMLQRISESARAILPGLIMTAAIVNHYHRAVGIFAQDPAKWTASGAIDYVIPMAYTPSRTEFASMVEGYRDILERDQMAIGINLGEMPNDPYTVAAQVHETVRAGTRGHVFFSQESLDSLARMGTAGGDLYAYLEGVRGERFVVAERVPSNERPLPLELLLRPAVAMTVVLAVLLLP
jgi:uncharacterized lipoprotein YddW (UPF0748 family)